MSERCAVGGEEIEIGFMGFGGNYSGSCRICGRVCCSNHFDKRKQLCPFCEEKLDD